MIRGLSCTLAMRITRRWKRCTASAHCIVGQMAHQSPANCTSFASVLVDVREWSGEKPGNVERDTVLRDSSDD